MFSILKKFYNTGTGIQVMAFLNIYIYVYIYIHIYPKNKNCKNALAVLQQYFLFSTLIIGSR